MTCNNHYCSWNINDDNGCSIFDDKEIKACDKYYHYINNKEIKMSCDNLTTDELKTEISRVEVLMAKSYSDYFHDQKHYDHDDVLNGIHNVNICSNKLYFMWEELRGRGVSL